MAVKFVAGITAWSANAATATSAAFTPATGETLLICGESFVAAAGVITGSQSTPIIDVAQANTSGGGANGSNSTGHVLFTKPVSQTLTIASAGGTFEGGFGIRYSGVAAVQKATCTLVAAPGTGANAIAGSPVFVPNGAILVVGCIDISNGPTTITSSNATASRFAVTTGNGVFNFFEFIGNGAIITPLCTTTTAADDYFMAQWLLLPAYGPSLIPKPVLFQKPFRYGFKGVTLDATPAQTAPATSGAASILEPFDIVSAAGATQTSSSAALIEPFDIVSAAGATATSSTAAIVELPDIGVIAGNATTSANGTGSIIEPLDIVSGAGSTATTATTALTESFDIVNASGSTATSAAAAIIEGLDFVSASGAGGALGVAGILEPFDTVVAAGSTASSASTTVVEPLDIVQASGNTAASASASIVEGLDFVSGAGSTASSSSAAIFELSDIVMASGLAITGANGTANILEGMDIVSGTATDNGGGTQPAGRHRKRYAVVDGWRLLVFDSKKLADEAKAAIQARINPPTKNQRRKLKVRMPTPDLVIDLHHVQASADKIGQTNEFVELQGKQDAQSLLKLHEDIQAQDDEDVALSVAHILADEDAQHAHLLKVIAMTTLLQRALRKT